MERNFTSAHLAEVLRQMQSIFDTAEVTDAENVPAAGMTVGYTSRMDGTDCVLSCPITVDGAPKMLRLSVGVAGAAPAEDPGAARELEMYRDDMNRDFLSGAYNRRYWESVFCRGISAHVAAGQPVAVALVKVDDFGAIVKAHGQPVGDQLVCYVANVWKKYYDEKDEKIVCRLTGHTFAVGCVGAEAIDLESQLRVLYEQMNLTCTSTVGMMCRVPFTLSIAAAGTDEVSDKVWPELYALCDQRLRAQIAAGGNGVYTAK
ncbi:MAG: diguanylate cyclase [Faecalibacterium sp.]|jgi:diguanylate cyclase (GGDEF)-like protein|nr:diguanylate cyclase [Faecalibacterium sp.]